MKAIVVKMRNAGKYFGNIAKSQNVFLMLCNISYSSIKLNSQRYCDCLPSKEHEQRLRRRADSTRIKKKTANVIRVSVFDDNDSSPSERTVKRRLRENYLEGFL